MLKHFLWWLVEMVIGFLFIYIGLYAVKNPVNLGWVSFVLVLLASFGFFASPLTRHLSFWNKVIDEIMEKEEEKSKF